MNRFCHVFTGLHQSSAPKALPPSQAFEAADWDTVGAASWQMALPEQLRFGDVRLGAGRLLNAKDFMIEYD